MGDKSRTGLKNGPAKFEEKKGYFEVKGKLDDLNGDRRRGGEGVNRVPVSSSAKT